MSYDYGTTFTLVSDKFQLSEVKAKDGSKQVISQFYHSPADNRRVSHSQYYLQTAVRNVRNMLTCSLKQIMLTAPGQ